MGGGKIGYFKKMERKMKKILMTAILCFVSSEAYEIKNTHWSGNGSTRHKVHTVQCNNSSTIIAQYYPSSNTYHSSGRTYNTLNQALNNSCSNKSTKTTTLRKIV